MAANKLALYSYFRSSSAWRIRIVLAIKGLDYEYKTINLLKKEQISDSYLALNPMGQVPALESEGQILTQSASIFEYLEEAFPDKPLLPKDKLKRAKVREISEVIVSGIQPVQNLSLLQKLPEDQRKQWAHDAIARGFTAVEALLKTSSAKYCVGDDLSWADCCLIPQIFNAKRFSVDMSKFPTISRIAENLEVLEPFKESHPTRQPDCPDELRESGM